MRDIGRKLNDSFYRGYLLYTALETELLFYVVCDVMFLTQVKGLTMEQVSQITFLSLAFSLVILYPLLKFINLAGIPEIFLKEPFLPSVPGQRAGKNMSI